MAKRQQTQNRIQEILFKHKGRWPNTGIGSPREVVESPSLEIYKAQPALAAPAQAGVGLDGLQRCLQSQPLCNSDMAKENEPSISR